jgi:hypothetical protein
MNHLSPGPLIVPSVQLRTFPTIRADICNLACPTGVNNTGLKWENVNTESHILFGQNRVTVYIHTG